MQIRATFWDKLRQLCAQSLGDSNPLRSQIDDRFARIADSAPDDRHRIIADVFTMLGGLPNAADLGFLIGGRMPLTAYGPLSLGVLTAPTISHALRLAADVHNLMALLTTYTYEENASEGRLTIGFRHPVSSTGEALAVAACAATFESAIAHHSGRSANFARLELTSSSKGNEPIYRKRLSLLPHTSSKSNALVFARDTLDLPNDLADMDTYKSVVRACRDMAEQQAGTSSLVERARQAILSDIGAPPSQENLAKMLNLTPRQLRTHLARSRTNYQEIVRDCRTQYAQALLKNPSLTLSQIADRLGYLDQSAFSHAYRRWTGKGPSAFRIGTDAVDHDVRLHFTDSGMPPDIAAHVLEPFFTTKPATLGELPA